MKKIALCLMTIFMALTFNTNQLKAETLSCVNTKENTSQEVKTILLRLDEIKKMDVKHLSKMEKNNIQKELVCMKEKLKVLDPGIYLSLGTIIIILLLLYIIF